MLPIFSIVAWHFNWKHDVICINRKLVSYLPLFVKISRCNFYMNNILKPIIWLFYLNIWDSKKKLSDIFTFTKETFLQPFSFHLLTSTTLGFSWNSQESTLTLLLFIYLFIIFFGPLRYRLTFRYRLFGPFRYRLDQVRVSAPYCITTHLLHFKVIKDI